MFARLLPLALALALTSAAAPLAAQSAAPACVTEWGCSRVPQPLGFHVLAVEDGGRYVALADGTVWEVEISDRATTAAWMGDDFVNLSFIAAPRGDFEYLLTRVGDAEQRAAARLAGNRPDAQE
jgi:hypothetical protein